MLDSLTRTRRKQATEGGRIDMTEHIQITGMAVAEAIATERKRCIAICEGWIGTYQYREIKYTSA